MQASDIMINAHFLVLQAILNLCMLSLEMQQLAVKIPSVTQASACLVKVLTFASGCSCNEIGTLHHQTLLQAALFPLGKPPPASHASAYTASLITQFSSIIWSDLHVTGPDNSDQEKLLRPMCVEHAAYLTLRGSWVRSKVCC